MKSTPRPRRYSQNVVQLNRRVRFSVNEHTDSEPSLRNAYAAAPGTEGIARHYEVLVHCRGPVHPTYSYLIDIKAVDRAVRETLVPAIANACRVSPQPPMAHVLRSCMPGLNERLSGFLHSVRWYLNPTLSIEISMSPHAGPSATPSSKALLRQRFEFAASHRLHVKSLSEEENLRLFGKCTWQNGHGHNYHVEPCVEVSLDPQGRHTLTLRQLEAIVDDAIIKPFDHKYLNLDSPQFADASGVVPSVENIARVFFEILGPRLSRECPGASLREITVWESDRTSATYPG